MIVFRYAFAAIYIFLGVFFSSFVGAYVTYALREWSLDAFTLESTKYIAKQCAIYGLCTVFSIAVVLPSMFLIKHYIWPMLKYVCLKIRYIFHGS
ncbi:hypothetical protein DVP62_04940 [Yersinia enterocolitica]|nr:hypothetical protein [Yersinia enterocolitica]EKN5098659.1 hypothetical protein [Yersinia enterocolitica]EKN5124749.1 hypothetical protein [Yersinia enterocolitica]EKN6039612.1 hypothetical protein [Yersinia enterocolitica]EKN6238852.1 hypothetical protein [Yersinia enterocolitica]